MDTASLTVAYSHIVDCIGRIDGETHYRKILPFLSVVTPANGWYEVTLDGQAPVAIREGECFVVPGGVAHTIVHHFAPGAVMQPRFIFIQILHRGYTDLTAAIRPPLVLKGEQAAAMIALLDEGLQAEAVDSTAGVCLRTALAPRILAALLPLPPPLLLQQKSAVDAALRHIEKHLAEKLTLDDLAALCHLSRSTFCRNFRQVTGTAPMEYVMDKRLTRAATLCAEGETLSAIAARTGFYDEYHLSKAFSKHFGCSPSVYRTRFFTTK